MATPANLFNVQDMVGIREDMSNDIWDISKYDTPFYTSCPKTKATNVLHEWQTDIIRDSAENAHIHGGDITAVAVTPTVRLGNYTQNFVESASIAGGDEGLDKAGRMREMTYQLAKKGKALKKDIERALFANQARVSGTNTVAPRLAGLPAWFTTNTNFQSGNGGADPTGDGTDARTDDGTPTAFSQIKFNNTMQEIYTAGGKPDKVYLSPGQMNIALAFTGNNNQRANVDASTGKVYNDIVVYQTPWGTVNFHMSTECRPRDVFILQSDMWAVAIKRPMRNRELGVSGDSEKRFIITELTLEARNERASGAIFDNVV